ncbi:hypothetical protein RA264_27945, partial [Pseudomonas syringae pv. tagetis]|uniref:hypothetical protein n=1 Tax=Pseudomonas syringae group genomosp. 7 TaxID=251699 RepID=UPI0037702B52
MVVVVGVDLVGVVGWLVVVWCLCLFGCGMGGFVGVWGWREVVGVDLCLGGCVGIAWFAVWGSMLEGLLRAGDIAMYEA